MCDTAGVGSHVGRRVPPDGAPDVVGVQHHVGPQRLDTFAERAGAARRRARPRGVVEHREQCVERAAMSSDELVGDRGGTEPRALVDLTLGGLVAAEPVEPAGDHVGELAHDVFGDVARRPAVAAARPVPLGVGSTDRIEGLEAAELGAELGLGQGTGQGSCGTSGGSISAPAHARPPAAARQRRRPVTAVTGRREDRASGRGRRGRCQWSAAAGRADDVQRSGDDDLAVGRGDRPGPGRPRRRRRRTRRSGPRRRRARSPRRPRSPGRGARGVGRAGAHELLDAGDVERGEHLGRVLLAQETDDERARLRRELVARARGAARRRRRRCARRRAGSAAGCPSPRAGPATSLAAKPSCTDSSSSGIADVRLRGRERDARRCRPGARRAAGRRPRGTRRPGV